MPRRTHALLCTLLVGIVLTACGGGSNEQLPDASPPTIPDPGPGPIPTPDPAPTPGIACGAEAATMSTANIPPDNSPTPASVPPGGAAILIEPVFTALKFERPLALLQTPDDNLCWFIVEQPGTVRSFANQNETNTHSTFIDISGRVDDGKNEAGLLGMAFHPNYAINGQVFLSYTGNNGGVFPDGLTSYVSRFTTSDHGKTLDPDSEVVLLSLTQPYNNHNGGNILFGPDGFLYIGFGDGGSGNDPDSNAQNTMNLYGTILRIDVDGETPYKIPAANPFAGNALCSQGVGAADCPEIFAWGLRNPWRWSFDLDTSVLWVGDVGQRAFEEIDIIVAGGNYGWPFFEGTRCNGDTPLPNCDFTAIPPVTEYPRTTGRSVTGGYVYRGSEITDLFGVYVYADYATGIVFQYFKSDTGDVIQAQIDTELKISSFGQAANGELYLLDLAAGGIHKITTE
jgi:glucose/arabinose dehydrogenase